MTGTTGESWDKLRCPSNPPQLHLHLGNHPLPALSPLPPPFTESLALPFISGGMLATETLSEGKRDRGREEERVMARISIPLCCTALLQGLGGMGWGWGCGEGARGREALLEGGRRQGWRRVRGRGGTAWQLNPPRPVY